LSQQLEQIQVEPRNSRGWPKNQMQLDWALAHITEGLSIHAAALKAGYSAGTAQKVSYQMVDKMGPFLGFLQEKKNALAERRYNASTTRVLDEITAMAFMNHADYVHEVSIDGIPHLIGKPLTELTDREQLAVQSWKIVKISTDDGPALDYQYVLADKAQNLFMLGKHLGMFNEKIMLELTHRQAMARRVRFSDLPTDKIEEIMETLKEFKELALNGKAIEGTATLVEPAEPV
jgi:phage terminase small subunit